MSNIRNFAINTIRVLSAEAITKANSGHPGLPLGAAPIGYCIYANMKHNPKNANWENRDRFILSAGHGSMLVYSLLHLFGYGITTDDLMNFRQVGSTTAGHPEYKHTVGVETTTGPLGQGIANGVGMALAEAHLAAKFNKPNLPIINHYTYVLAGDGCMQEGISYEAASFAGTYGLDKLIVFYDDNDITIEGSTDITFRENVGKRHEAQGWHVQYVADANDVDAMNKAISKAKKVVGKPHLIVVKSVIGFGSPLAGKADCHGSPLSKEGIVELRKNLDYSVEGFGVDESVKNHFDELALKGKREESKWKKLLKQYKEQYPTEYIAYSKALATSTVDLSKEINLYEFDSKADATRNTSYNIINKLSELVPNLVGGSADLAPANKTYMKKRSELLPENLSGTNIHFGIREHSMSAICNGLALHRGVIPYCATFLVFSDYMKNAMRMSAIMQLPVIYVLSHDSIGVGEDGATHQPIEHLAGLRAMPNLKVYRPADGRETAAAYINALSENMPTCIVVSRQNLPQYSGSGDKALRGGYVLSDSTKATADAIIIATGSEVEQAMEAQKVLLTKGVDVRVVSMPCMEVFERQPQKYRDSVLPKGISKRLAVEAGSTMPWYKYVGTKGAIIGIDTFGESGPAGKLFVKYGFTVENIVEKVLGL